MVASQAADTTFRVGTVSAFDPSGVALQVQVQGGVLENVGFLQSYQPAIGDSVLLALNGQTWIALGSLNQHVGGFAARQTVPAGQTLATVRFVIPTNMTELVVGYSARCAKPATDVDDLRIRLNDSAAAVYTSQDTQGNGAGTGSVLIDSGGTSAFIGQVPAVTSAAGVFGSGNVWFQGWDLTGRGSGPSWTFHNAMMSHGGLLNVGGGWANLAGPLFSLTFLTAGGQGFVAGSTFYVRGYV